MPRYLSPSSHQYCPPVSILFFEFYLTLSTNIGVSFEKSYFLFISARSFTFLALFFFIWHCYFFVNTVGKSNSMIILPWALMILHVLAGHAKNAKGCVCGDKP